MPSLQQTEQRFYTTLESWFEIVRNWWLGRVSVFFQPQALLVGVGRNCPFQGLSYNCLTTVAIGPLSPAGLQMLELSLGSFGGFLRTLVVQFTGLVTSLRYSLFPRCSPRMALQGGAKAGLQLRVCKMQSLFLYYCLLIIVLFPIWTTVNLLSPHIVYHKTSRF